MEKKTSPAKIIGIIFCILTVAVMAAIFVISADLRGCKKAIGSYFNGISRGNYSAYESALPSELRSEISAEEQESYMAETFGKYVGTMDKGVRITYSVKGMEEYSIKEIEKFPVYPDGIKEVRGLFLEVRAWSTDFDERGNATVLMCKIKGKWYVYDVKVA